MAKNFIADAPLNRREHILFVLLYGMVYAMSLLPLSVLYLFSDGLYLLVYRIVGYRRHVVRRNLANSFPEKSEAERRAIERGFYRFFCDYIVETVKMASISRREITRRVRYTGLEYVRQALDANRNVALYLAHYCNWEWITSIMLFMPQDIYGGQVYHVLTNKVMDKLLLRLRSRMGTVNIPRFELLRRVVEQKKAGRRMVIGFISDQAPEMHTITFWTDFLHQDTAVISGTETIARKYDFACLFLNIRRPRRGYYDVSIEPLAMDAAPLPPFEVTERYARALERNIRQQPENWLWTHNRWKRTRQHYEQFLATHKNNR